jgi:hypothetical protein
VLTVRRSTAGGTPGFRVLAVRSGATANISGLTLNNGGDNVNIFGGILNDGTLALSAVAVDGNQGARAAASTTPVR